jgi:predicted dehydrogenase
MIRLAVYGGHAAWPQLRDRLQGAHLEGYPGNEIGLPADRCDAVVVLEPCGNDVEAVRRWLSDGKHALLTPQPWLSGDALEQLSATARETGVQLTILNPDRFLPSRQLIKQQLDSGGLGQPGLVRMHRWQHREVGKIGEAGSEVAAPGQVPITQDVDTALWLMGEAPNVVYSAQRAGEEAGLAADRSVLVHLGFPGGGMALIDYTNELPPGGGYQSLALIGSTGAAHADDHQNMQLLFRGGPPRAIRVDESSRQTLALVQSFVSDLEQERDLWGSVSAWQMAITVADAANRSADSGRAIPLAGR